MILLFKGVPITDGPIIGAKQSVDYRLIPIDDFSQNCGVGVTLTTLNRLSNMLASLSSTVKTKWEVVN